MTDVRASDAEREATVERLRDAAAEGRLTFEELADRIEAAGAAVMRSDLVPLTADIPAAVAIRDDAPERVHALGDVKRSGSWAVPGENHFRSWLGHIKLDLRQARISGTEIHIHGRCSATSTCSYLRASRSTSARTPGSGRSSRKTAPPCSARRGSSSPAARSSATSRSAHQRLWEKFAGRLLG